MRPEWILQLRSAAAELGLPVFGLRGPNASDGVVSGYGGQPCTRMTLRYRTPAWRVEVTTATQPLGGTDNLVRNLLLRAIPTGVHLPWGVQLDERRVMIPVDDTPTSFRLITATTGDWMAAGGFEKRHLLVAGTDGVDLDQLALGPVALDFDA